MQAQSEHSVCLYALLGGNAQSPLRHDDIPYGIRGQHGEQGKASIDHFKPHVQSHEHKEADQKDKEYQRQGKAHPVEKAVARQKKNGKKRGQNEHGHFDKRHEAWAFEIPPINQVVYDIGC